jgi:ankyrin repeat protein
MTDTTELEISNPFYELQDLPSVSQEAKHIDGSELIFAILNRENAVAIRLIRNGYDIEFVVNFGYNALICATQRKIYSVMEVLIRKNVNLNKQTKDSGISAIILAAMNCDLKAFNILFEAGADVRLLNKKNQSALNFAAKNGSYDMVFKIIQRLHQISVLQCDGASEKNQKLYTRSQFLAYMNQKDDYGYNPLIDAVINQHESIVKLLVENHANCDNIDHFGGFYLNNAIKLGKVEIAKHLVRAGANIHHFDENYKSGFDLATAAGYDDLVLEMINNQCFLGNN